MKQLQAQGCIQIQKWIQYKWRWPDLWGISNNLSVRASNKMTNFNIMDKKDISLDGTGQTQEDMRCQPWKLELILHLKTVDYPSLKAIEISFYLLRKDKISQWGYTKIKMLDWVHTHTKLEWMLCRNLFWSMKWQSPSKLHFVLLTSINGLSVIQFITENDYCLSIITFSFICLMLLIYQ